MKTLTILFLLIASYSFGQGINGTTTINNTYSGGTDTTFIYNSLATKMPLSDSTKFVYRPAYGSMYISDDHPDSIIVGSTTILYTIGAKQGANGYKFTSGGVLKNVSVQDSSMTVLIAGNYEASYSASCYTATGVVNGKFNFYIYVDDVKQEKTGNIRLFSGSNDMGTMCAAPTVLTLTAGQVIKLKVKSPDDNGNTFVVEYCIVHLKKIDN